MCNCDKNKCLLDYLFPNTSASMACDSKCNFKTKNGKANLNWYKENYPKHIESFNKINSDIQK